MLTDNPAEDPHGPLKIGARLRKYEILALIGRGGYASVYRARDTIFNRAVAIKVIHRIGGANEDMVRRGQAEATFLTEISHPNIVKVYDADITDGGLLYIVMELLVGRTLFDALCEHGRLAVEEALLIGSQIATAVQAAHQKGAIHRDLKPENIFITAQNTAKVLDFGIAKFVNDVGAKTTAKDALQGSVLYMSPEHVKGTKVGTRTDIYALGMILYRALYGEHPALMAIENRAPWAVAAWHVEQMPRPLSEIADWIPRHVSRIISSACAKDLRDRPESMAALSSLLIAARDRYLAETHGELGDHTRDLSQAIRATEPPVVLPLPGRSPLGFQPFNNAPEEGRTIPGTGKKIEEPRPVRPAPSARPTPQRPAPTAVQPRVLPTKPAHHGTARANYWLIAAAISGAVVFGAITKFYFIHRRNTAQATVLAVNPEPPPSVLASIGPPPPSAATASSIAPVPTTAPAPRKVALKPKKLDPSEQRLKALEDELKRRQRAKAEGLRDTSYFTPTP